MKVRQRNAPPERASPTPGCTPRTVLGADGSAYTSGDSRRDQRRPRQLEPSPSEPPGICRAVQRQPRAQKQRNRRQHHLRLRPSSCDGADKGRDGGGSTGNVRGRK